jgi:hypothetical protein
LPLVYICPGLRHYRKIDMKRQIPLSPLSCIAQKILIQERYEVILRITAWAATPTFLSKSCLHCCGQFPKESPTYIPWGLSKVMIEIRIIFPACVFQGSIVTRLFFTSVLWRQNKTSFLKEVSLNTHNPPPTPTLGGLERGRRNWNYWWRPLKSWKYIPSALAPRQERQ